MAEVSLQDVVGLLSETLKVHIQTQRQVQELGQGMDGLRDEVRSGFAQIHQDIVDVRQAIVGHGILMEEYRARIERIERVLNLPPMHTS